MYIKITLFSCLIFSSRREENIVSKPITKKREDNCLLSLKICLVISACTLRERGTFQQKVLPYPHPTVFPETNYRRHLFLPDCEIWMSEENTHLSVSPVVKVHLSTSDCLGFHKRKVVRKSWSMYFILLNLLSSIDEIQILS